MGKISITRNVRNSKKKKLVNILEQPDPSSARNISKGMMDSMVDRMLRIFGLAQAMLILMIALIRIK